MLRRAMLLVLVLLTVSAHAGEFYAPPLSTPPAVVSPGNATSTPLTAGSVYTGEWEDVGTHPSMTVAVSTDQAGTYAVQFSPDAVNVDSSLMRYHIPGTIEPPHRFTITRRYARLVITNTSASDQTYLRAQVIYGAKPDLNAPLDSTLAQDYDAIVVRPTDPGSEIALGLRQGSVAWNKWGSNLTVGTAAELIAPWGGTYTPRTTATTLSLVSTSGNDTDGGTGAHGVVIYGVDTNRTAQVEVVLLTGLTPVVTTSTWLGINRVALYRAGTLLENEGDITVTGVTGSTIEAQVAAGAGTTQQCIFFVQSGHKGLVEWATLNVARFGSGAEPTVTIKGWVFSPTSNAKYEIFRLVLDATITGAEAITPPIPFPLTEGTVFWFEATSSRADTVVNARISLVEVRNIDG
jgi:hypothetical protein